MELKDLIAIWGALLSTGLGVIKFFEWWRDRHQIDVSYSFSTSAYDGNIVFIRNLSNRPIIITHWQLFAADDRKRKQGYTHIASAEFDAGDHVVAANASYELKFIEGDHFNTSPKFLKGRSIFIELRIAGRRPEAYMVYP